MADFNLPSAEDSRKQQTGNGNNEVAVIKQGDIIAPIVSAVTVRSAGGSSYADFNFSVFKSGKYTKLLLSYIGLTAAKGSENVVVPVADTKEKYYGTDYLYEYDNDTWKKTTEETWWKTNVVDYLIEHGYDWTLIYYRDQEVPFGFRVSWFLPEGATADYKADTDPNNPIYKAQHEEFPYKIIPETRFVFQPAEEVEIVNTTPALQEATLNSIRGMLALINTKITQAATNGKENILIPWVELGGINAQTIFMQKKDIASVQEGSGDATSLSEVETTALFEYSTSTKNTTLNGKTYSAIYYGEKSKYRIYNVNEITDNNTVSLFFFSNAAMSGLKYKQYDVTQDSSSDTDTIKDFTMKELLAFLGYDINLYADIDENKNPYCKGIAISWKNNTATTIACEYYATRVKNYEEQTTISYSWDSLPTHQVFDEASKKLHSTYLSKFIDLTISKMYGAFEKGEQTIVILWTDIDAKNPEQVCDKWLTSSNIAYDGPFFTPNGTINSSSIGLRGGYNTLVNGVYYNNLQTNSQHEYIWAYVQYKATNTEAGSVEGGGGNGLTQPDSLHDSCGIVITLVKKGNAYTNRDTVKALLQEQITYYAKKTDPNKKS